MDPVAPGMPLPVISPAHPPPHWQAPTGASRLINRRNLCLLVVLLLSLTPLLAPLYVQAAGDVSRNDTDGDQVVDTADVDDDNDGIPDVLEIRANGDDRDSDRDGQPDRLDLDSDNDGILDWQESGAAQQLSISSLRPVGGKLVGAVGDNGLIDIFESPVDTGRLAYRLINTDVNHDDIPDVLDLDSDNDGLTDLNEAGVAPARDNDRNARIDAPPGSVGNDGIADYLQSTNDATCCDVTGDGVDDNIPRNTDGGDLPDFQDLDSDNDGVSDLVESGGIDLDGDGHVDNFVDSVPEPDGMDDALLVTPISAADDNGNGVPDHLDASVQARPRQPSADPVTPSGTGNGNSPGNAAETGDDGSTLVTGPDVVPTRPGGASATDADTGETSASGVQDDGGSGEVYTGLSASGCSVQSASQDALLILCVLLSLSWLGWRFTVKKPRR